jgi:hypothetical protein
MDSSAYRPQNSAATKGAATKGAATKGAATKGAATKGAAAKLRRCKLRRCKTAVTAACTAAMAGEDQTGMMGEIIVCRC